MRSRLAVLMLTLVSSLCLAASPQKPTKTKYLITTVGSFEMTEESGVAYSMAYDVREKLPAQVFVVAIFENPESPREPLRREFEVPADAKSIKLESPGFRSIRNDVLYKVSLSLYLDAGHKNRLIQHDQKVLFKMGKQMHSFVQHRYPLCQRLGYDFKHHNALADAKAAAHILLSAIKKSGLDLGKWLQRVRQPIDPSSSGASIRRDGNPEGPLYGEVIVFTGALEIPRREAADLAAALGCNVAPSVSKKVSLLVVGDQDVSKLAGHAKSSKHRKAEELIAEGASIRIIRESDFKELVRLADEVA